MEATVCIRAYFKTKQQSEDVFEYLYEDNRPIFAEGLSKSKEKLFEILEFAENPEEAHLCTDSSISASWFIGSDELFDEIIDSLIQCGVTHLYALVDADDYSEFYKKTSDSKKITITRDTEDADLTDAEINMSCMELLEREFDLNSCDKS